MQRRKLLVIQAIAKAHVDLFCLNCKFNQIITITSKMGNQLSKENTDFKMVDSNGNINNNIIFQNEGKDVHR